MGKQQALIVMPRRPSLTAATTRANRAKAREWAKALGFEAYADRWCTDDCSGFNTGHASGGFLIRLHDRVELAPVCVDCIPYDGSPLRNHEHWSGMGPTDNCVRCLRSMRDRGGSYVRGGPVCWECGGGFDGDERVTYETWLIALRKDTNAPHPFRGDKAVRS
jgi:hypothetical protein